jgi:hypothetical protein
MTLPLGTLLRQDVIKVGLGALEAALPGAAESLRRTAIGFHLRHFLLRL